MALAVNAVMTFMDYQLLDNPLGIEFHFVCSNPGPGQPSDYTVIVTDAEWAAATNNTQRRTLVTNKLQRKYRAAGLATALDGLIGSTFTV